MDAQHVSSVSKRFVQVSRLLALGVFGVALCVASCIAQEPTTVVLGGTGPTPHLQTVIDGISDLLSSNGAKVKVTSGDAKSRSVILEEMKQSGNTNLLYVSVNQVKGQRGKILAECFVDGKKVWEEDTRGSLMAISAEGEVRGMLKSINEKIKKHIGGTGIPKQPS